jgi:hypothetical protein
MRGNTLLCVCVRILNISILLVTKTTKQNAKLQKAKISLPVDEIQLQILFSNIDICRRPISPLKQILP